MQPVSTLKVRERIVLRVSALGSAVDNPVLKCEKCRRQKKNLPMSKEDQVLSRVNVASPCAMSFEDMDGDEKVRFCQQCRKNVHNLSNMSKKEAAEVIAKSNGKVCAFFSRDAKGKIVTDNCPEFLKATRNKVRDQLANIASGLVICGLLPSMFLVSRMISGGGGISVSPATQETTKNFAPIFFSTWAGFKVLTLSLSKLQLGKALERFLFAAVPFSVGLIMYCSLFPSGANFMDAVLVGLLLSVSTYGFSSLLGWLKRSTEL